MLGLVWCGDKAIRGGKVSFLCFWWILLQMLPGNLFQECGRWDCWSCVFLSHIGGGSLYKLTVALMAELLEMSELLSWLVLISCPC